VLVLSSRRSAGKGKSREPLTAACRAPGRRGRRPAARHARRPPRAGHRRSATADVSARNRAHACDVGTARGAAPRADHRRMSARSATTAPPAARRARRPPRAAHLEPRIGAGGCRYFRHEIARKVRQRQLGRFLLTIECEAARVVAEPAASDVAQIVLGQCRERSEDLRMQASLRVVNRPDCGDVVRFIVLPSYE
jgi:hypothetical protein